MLNNQARITEYAIQSWELGRRNHQIEIIRDNFYNTLKILVKEDYNENTSS